MKKIDKNISINEATINNIPEIVDIHKKCVLGTNTKAYPKDVIKEWVEMINIKNTESQFSDSSWFVFKVEGKLTGFCQFSFKEKSLFQMNILPSEQGKGYGKILYDFAENQFLKEGLDEINLNATLNAVDFYKRLGFKEIKQIKFKLNKISVKMIKMVKKLHVKPENSTAY